MLRERLILFFMIILPLNVFGAVSTFNKNAWFEGYIDTKVEIVDVMNGNILKAKTRSEDLYNKIKMATEPKAQLYRDNIFNDHERIFSIRLFGVNTEMKPLSNEEYSKLPKLISSLEEKLLGKESRIFCFMTDFYGRPVCSLLYNSKYDLSLWLIREGYSYYDMTNGIHPLKELHEYYKKGDKY